MVHRSYLSPDGKSVLLVEMDNGGFVPCRVVPFDGSSAGRRVGPPNSRCTSAGWSPDGAWMYLSVHTGGGYHTWRQRADGSQLEQITFGPTEQEGIAVSHDGRSLITSVGSTEGSLVIHDSAGERQLSGEGSAFNIKFAPEGRKLYYLATASADPAAVNNQERTNAQLWVADLATGKSERPLPGVGVIFYDISADGKQVVYSSRDSSGKRRVFLSPLDRRTPPQPVLTEADDEVWFGGPNELIFRSVEGSVNYVYRSQLDGSGRRKIISEPILELGSVSPNGQWVMVWKPVPERDGESSLVMAFPTAGGPGIEFCHLCIPHWSEDGKWMVSNMQEMSPANARVFLLPIAPGKSLPALPPGGIKPNTELKLPGAKVLPENCTPGVDPSTYACVKLNVHRNLYRIPLP
jgi:Tol biopolymer transport system component